MNLEVENKITQNVNIFLKKHKELEEKIVYYEGIKLWSNPNVLMPFLTKTSNFFQKNISLNDAKTCIEIGVGSGFNIIKLSQRHPFINFTGTDINPEALYVAEKNFILNNISANLIESNLFVNIKGKFDIILFNPPFLIKEPRSLLEKSIFDKNGEVVKGFFRSVRKHMHTKSKIYFIYTNINYKYSSTQEFLKEQVKLNNLKNREISSSIIGAEISTNPKLISKVC